MIIIEDSPELNRKKILNNVAGGDKWLKRLHKIIHENMDDVSLNNERLAVELQVSERKLFRKIKEITGQSPQKYLSTYRLESAKQYLEAGKYLTVKETSASVGFRNTSYFIRQFERKFGKKPLQVLREAGWR